MQSLRGSVSKRSSKGPWPQQGTWRIACCCPSRRIHAEAWHCYRQYPPSMCISTWRGIRWLTGGLEHLFGVTSVEDGKPQYHDWWAHDAAEEQRAFQSCIDWMYARWRADSTMHLYHYAAYEVTALRKLMGRYGTREAEVDTLLRNEVFVDLYTIVRQGLRVGALDYSLKALERLYRASRTGGVTTAGDSLVFYDRWLVSGESRHWEESPSLCAIKNQAED